MLLHSLCASQSNNFSYFILIFKYLVIALNFNAAGVFVTVFYLNLNLRYSTFNIFSKVWQHQQVSFISVTAFSIFQYFRWKKKPAHSALWELNKRKH